MWRHYVTRSSMDERTTARIHYGMGAGSIGSYAVEGRSFQMVL